MKRCEQNAGRWAQLALLAGVVLVFGVAKVLSPTTGWENGWFEVAQNIFLGAAGCMSLWQVSRLRTASHQALLWVAALIWWIFMGREMSWGAVFLQPSSWSDTAGPIWSSRALLWYRPAVPWVVGSLLLVVMALAVHRKAWRAFVLLSRNQQWPWAALGLFALCFALASQAEGKGGLDLEAWYGLHAVVLEELLETLGYLALWLAQVQVFWALRAAQPLAPAAAPNA